MNAGEHLQLWGGIECTHNRVGEQFFDQLSRSGHHRRADDIALIRELGIRKVRYPLLWERIAPNGPEQADWAWADARMTALREAEIEPIVGLVHHGSGPRGVDLLSDDFATGLAAYAGSVAARYPWVRDFTPVNEPLTTARFSGLYGRWYPHAESDAAFVRMLLVQSRATALAMTAIRRVRPDARLVQTDDLGRTHGTRRLAYQARFENERRWLGWDLLFGRVRPSHPMYGYLRESGASAADLAWHVENACPPDVVGVNHYLTSERFLDHRLALYPAALHGGNGQDRYVDVEAVRVRGARVAGLGRLLRETAARYPGTSISITECHAGGPRDEQVRWLTEAWTTAKKVRAQGVPVCAVTTWALMGSFDWNSLVTRADGYYEPGAFDVRGPTPRRTAIGSVVAALCRGETPAEPAAFEPGWWRRDEHRLCFGPPASGGGRARVIRRVRRPLLIVGTSGTLATAARRIAEERGLTHRALSRCELDLAGEDFSRVLDQLKPWAVLNAAGYVRVDDAEADEAACMQTNAGGPAGLARACAERGVRLAVFSSDLVFDGRKGEAYVEEDRPSPLNAYGRSKAALERDVAVAWPEALVVRTGPFFGPWDEYNFAWQAVQAAIEGRIPITPDGGRVSPVYVPDLVHAVLDLLIDRAAGLWHLVNDGETTWVEWARASLEAFGVANAGIRAVSAAEFGWSAARPADSRLKTAKGQLLPPFECAFRRFVAARQSTPAAAIPA
jgi:dTDP-4-dehydrorhamnose reductase